MLYSYKESLITFLIDRLFKICNNWNSVHNDTERIISYLTKNAYRLSVMYRVIKKYLENKFSANHSQLKDISNIHYFRLPYTNKISDDIKMKLSKL